MTASDDQTSEPTPERASGQGPEQAPGQTPGHPGYWDSPNQPHYPQPPYGQPPYGQNQYGQPQYPQYNLPYPTWPPYGPPDHPKANLAFVLGLISGPGAFVSCGLTLLAAPFAWYFAALVRRDVAASPGRYSAETSKVTAGLVLGIIGTALLALAFVLVVVVIIFVIADPGAFDSGTTV